MTVALELSLSHHTHHLHRSSRFYLRYYSTAKVKNQEVKCDFFDFFGTRGKSAQAAGFIPPLKMIYSYIKVLQPVQRN